MNAAKPSLDARLRAQYGALPPSERAIADLLLENASLVATHSATELSKRAAVSKAAATRLVQRLGYGDYRALRDEVREARAAGYPLFMNQPNTGTVSGSRRLFDHLENDLLALTRTIESVRTDYLDEAVRAVAGADRVYLVGMRNSHFFASYVRHQLTLARPDVILLPMPGQIVMEDLANVTARDAVVVVGLRRRPAVLKKVLAWLRSQGVTTALFTDARSVQAASLASWTFRCQTRGVSIFDSYVGVMSLLSYFCERVVAALKESGRVRLQLIEANLTEADEIETEIA